MSTVVKLDGFQSFKERRQRFVDMFASEAIAKGDLVALDLSATEPTNGYGNHIKKAGTTDDLTKHGVGIALEAIGNGEKGTIQVAGYCDFAKCSNLAATYDGGGDALNDADEGILLTVSAEDGHLRDYDTSAAEDSGGDSLPVAILIEYGTADTADSIVYLLNPANL